MKQNNKQNPKLNAPVERQTKHQNITCSPAHSTTKQGSRYGPLVCPSKNSSVGLQRICSWHPSMRHSRERGSSQCNHHIKCRRRTNRKTPWPNERTAKLSKAPLKKQVISHVCNSCDWLACTGQDIPFNKYWYFYCSLSWIHRWDRQRVCMCKFVYLCVCVCVCVCARTCELACVCVCVSVCVCGSTRVRACMRACMHACERVHAHARACACMHACVRELINHLVTSLPWCPHLTKAKAKTGNLRWQSKTGARNRAYTSLHNVDSLWLHISDLCHPRLWLIFHWHGWQVRDRRVRAYTCLMGRGATNTKTNEHIFGWARSRCRRQRKSNTLVQTSRPFPKLTSCHQLKQGNMSRVPDQNGVSQA